MKNDGELFTKDETGNRYRAIIRGALHTPPLPAKEFPKKRAHRTKVSRAKVASRKPHKAP
jgi:hypothetical protein